jgi:hypothetical protein
MVQTEKKNDCRSFYSAGDAVLVKTVEELLLPDLITEYRVTKERNLKVNPNAGANFFVNRLFIVITDIILRVASVYFNVNCVVLDGAPLQLVLMCFLPNVQLYTATHPDAELRKSGKRLTNHW